MSRFAAFSDDELRELWDGLTMDDGIRYSIAVNDQPARKLAEEIIEEARRRGLTLPDDWAAESTLRL